MIKYNNKNIELMNHTDDLVNKVMYMDSVAYKRMNGEPTPPPVPPTPIGKYFTIVFLENGDFKYLKDSNSGDLYYSLDEGATWSLIENNVTDLRERLKLLHNKAV